MAVSVICLNGLIAVGVCWLTYWFWQWRGSLIQLNRWLQKTEQLSHRDSQQMGYELMLRRAQIIEARLGLAQWKLRSRQIRQVLKLLSLLRTVLIYSRRL